MVDIYNMSDAERKAFKRDIQVSISEWGDGYSIRSLENKYGKKYEELMVVYKSLYKRVGKTKITAGEEFNKESIEALIKKVVYETRTCPEDIGLKNTYPKCEGSCPTDKADKCVSCFYQALKIL